MHSLFKKITFDCLKRRLILSTKILTFKWEPKTYLLPTHFSCSRTQTLNTVLIQHAKGWQLFSLLSHVWLFASPWTNLLQAPLSMGFPRQEYWAGCHFLLRGIFPIQGSNLRLLLGRQILYHWRDATFQIWVGSEKVIIANLYTVITMFQILSNIF